MYTGDAPLRKFTFRLPEPLFEQLERQANQRHVAVAEYIRAVLERGLLAETLDERIDQLSYLVQHSVSQGGDDETPEPAFTDQESRQLLYSVLWIERALRKTIAQQRAGVITEADTEAKQRLEELRE